MPRPRVIVSITSAPTPRSTPSSTGTGMVAFTGGTPVAGLPNPLRVTTADQVTAAYGTADTAVTTLAAYVADALLNGAPAIVIARATSAPTDAAGWGAVLDLLTEEYGPVAQVAIPGNTTTAARDALAAHAAKFSGRTVFLDAPKTATASDLTTLAGSYAAQAGSPRIAIVHPSVTMQGPGSTTRETPASVLAMGLVGRGDAYAGHANNAPAGDQLGRGAGVITGGVAPTATFTATDLDSLDDAGISVIRSIQGRPTLMGWVSVATDPAFHQLNVGRFIGQVAAGIRSLGQRYLFRPLDAQTFAGFETAIRGYLAPLRDARALWTGLDGSRDGYDVLVAPLNTADTVAARNLVSQTTISVTPYAHDVTLNLVTSVATEVPAA